MKIVFALVLLLLPFISLSNECTHRIRINDKRITLNKTNYDDIMTYFGDATKIKSIYEIPYYAVCYKGGDKKNSIIFGFDSNTNLLRFAQISSWNDVLGEYISCATSGFNIFSINGKFIGEEIKSVDRLNREVVSKNYCYIREDGSSVSGILVNFGVFLSDLE